ncbi:uncharacterized protein LOC106636110 [Copidosoma floridanum]|uniref:uncharacterized protein LOC106636110 n=1 Tax=Copidosoma floridanum TaxID=29053 RepID=UPI0006C93D47|nr:uncharacterized protein LOC106636110 [Copidosoma floridanum]
MVMAGIEGVSGPAITDESLSNKLQWLRQRREALEDKLAQKNSELKSLCIEEAELTGVLPPEIPLEPGESPPCIRKRASTSINYPQNFINKLKTNRVEESALEVERQVQINIAESALAILNDPSESKVVRRKQRAIYQQSQRRLQELNAQLNFIRQSHGSGSRSQLSHSSLHGSQQHLQTATKHRTKKLRPPLDSQGKDLSPMMESRGLLQEGGISLSPLGPEHNYNTYTNFDLQDVVSVAHGYGQPGSSLPHNRATYHAPSPVEQHSKQRLTGKFSEHELINNNLFVSPDQFRGRAYSQGGNSSGGSSVSPHHFSTQERPCRYLPNTYTEEERQMHYRQMKLRRQEAHEEMLKNQQYSDPRYSDNVEAHRRSAQIVYHETDSNSLRFELQPHDYPVHYNHAKPQPPGILRPRDSVDNVMQGPEYKSGKPAVDTYIPPGYWMRLDDEIVWCSEEQMSDRFGSLDRRKQTVSHQHHHHQLASGLETQSRYHTVALGGKNAPMLHARQPPYPHPPPVQSPDGSLKPTPPSSRMLLRTQSLGSVEGWQQQSPIGGTNSSQDANSSTTSIEDRESADGASSRSSIKPPKEKEWYETSLDGTGPPPPQRPIVRRGSQHNPQQPPPPPPLPPPPPAKDRMPVRSNSIPSNRRTREQLPVVQPHQQQQVQRPPIPQSRFHESRVLEIPAESKPSPGSQENGNQSIISLNPLTNRTIVQPGKYQPYREETKPFEMSDFYKYSTKFRNKKVEASTTNEEQHQQQQQQILSNVNTQNDLNQINNPILRVHQPVQQNTFNMR